MAFLGAYALQGLQGLLAQRKAEGLAAQARQDKLTQQGLDNDYRNRALAQQENLRQDALKLQAQSQAGLNADREMNRTNAINESIRPGGDFTDENPLTPRL